MARNSKSFRLPKLRHNKPRGQGVVDLSGKQIYLGRCGSVECQKAYMAFFNIHFIADHLPLRKFSYPTSISIPIQRFQAPWDLS